MNTFRSALRRRTRPWFATALTTLGLGLAGGLSAREPSADTFSRQVVPFLDQYCFSCHGRGKHKGDVVLDGWKDEASAAGQSKTWERVLQKVRDREMPPEEKRQPSARERTALLAWIDQRVLHCDCAHPDPGRVTLRRLNRAEYNNTIRDLLGVDFKPADDFPVDDSGYGFDTIGDALSMPPVLIEKYLAAARRILDQAFGGGPQAGPVTNRFAVDLLEVGYNAKQRGDGWVALNSIEEDDVAIKQDTPGGGDYFVRVRAYARRDGSNDVRLTFLRDANPVQEVVVETNAAAPRVYEARLHIPPGRHRLRAAVRRNKDGLPEAQALKWKSGRLQPGTVFVEYLEVVGPLPAGVSDTGAGRRELPSAAPGKERSVARDFLDRFVRRAYRRPPTPAELDRLVELAWAAADRCATLDGVTDPGRAAPQGGACFEEGLRVALQAVLVSPHFLFRGELQPEPDNPASAHPIDEYALAARLSYFLWSSLPDDELLRLAGQGRLRSRLEGQVRRMLRDPRSRALVDNFGGQWLQLRNLELAAPDGELFPSYNERLRAAMRRETELFFEHLLREDRSVVEFLTADYTFLNDDLIHHYGLAGVPDAGTGQFRRVSLRGTPRRGVLTQASVLLLTSNPTRTSPVKRGKWVLETLLGAPPPPPPPNVPDLKDGKELTGTLRERMEQHRADALCASCHARLDPIGFGLENFDAIGRWRTLDRGEAIDASGRLTTGEKFQGAPDLTRLLAETKRDAFVRCFAEKLLTYALGRGLEHYDKCAVDEIGKAAARRGYRLSSVVTAVVRSVPFQMRRGDEAAGELPETAGSSRE